MIGIDIKEEKEYILKSDRSSENPTIFVLKPLTASEFIKINSVLLPYGDEKETQSKKIDAEQAIKTIIPTVFAGVKKIKNIFSSKENKAVDIEKPSLADIDALSFDVLSELYGEIINLNKMSETEEKN